MAINREQFMAATQRRFLTWKVPVLGECRFRSLTQREMLDIKRSWFDDKGNRDMDRIRRADHYVVAMSLVDDDGNRIVSDDDVGHGFFDHIDGGPWAVICDVVKRHTGWDCGTDWTPIQNALGNS